MASDCCNELLLQQQIETYLRDGVLVVDAVLNESELKQARDGLANTLQRHGIDPSNLSETGHPLAQLSSTGGAGGVLDVFFEDWKIAIATNEKLYRITTELWRAAYCHRGEAKPDLAERDHWKWHPYGAWDCRKAYMYLDRVGYRLPTALAEQLGATNKQAKGNKRAPIQRSLTPHLDCCPETLFDPKYNSKWRPIQCFVSLSDTLEPNHGGFECVPGFHREFDAWSQNRPPTVVTRKKKKSQNIAAPEYETITIPAPCVGQYTHIRPVEDASIFRRIQHFPVRAGSAVFWDVRLPHANAYRHNGTVPRAVVYCSFLPADVPMNRDYAIRQWHQHWIKGREPTDQWIAAATTTATASESAAAAAAAAAAGEEEKEKTTNAQTVFNDIAAETRAKTTAVDPVLQNSLRVAVATPLARKLVGLEPW